MRANNRRNNQLRPVKITPGYIDYAEGSVLIEAGKTRVLCAATVQAGVPKWLDGRGQGWLTAEYAMVALAASCGILARGGGYEFDYDRSSRRPSAEITGDCRAIERVSRRIGARQH